MIYLDYISSRGKKYLGGLRTVDVSLDCCYFYNLYGDGALQSRLCLLECGNKTTYLHTVQGDTIAQQ